MRTLFVFFFCGSTFFLSATTNDYILAADCAVFDLHIKRKLMLVEAQVDAQKGFFIIDTGAPDLVLNDVYFKQLSRDGRKQAYLDVEGWREGLELAKINSFAWGAVERQHFWVPITNLEHLEATLGLPILGLIGHAVFKNFELHIQYVQKKLTLYALDTPKSEQQLQRLGQADHQFTFKLHRHLAIVEAQMGAHHSLQLALDSGASVNIIGLSWRQKMQALAQRRWQISFYGTQSHAVQAPFYAFSKLLVEDRMLFYYWKAAFTDLRHFAQAALPIDGLLGINFFQIGTTVINYRTQTIRIWEEQSIFSPRYTTLK
ncbi:MAG: hypothetical protein AAF798_14575 [Bacteroidota bacterium]